MKTSPESYHQATKNLATGCMTALQNHFLVTVCDEKPEDLAYTYTLNLFEGSTNTFLRGFWKSPSPTVHRIIEQKKKATPKNSLQSPAQQPPFSEAVPRHRGLFGSSFGIQRGQVATLPQGHDDLEQAHFLGYRKRKGKRQGLGRIYPKIDWFMLV